MKTGMASGTGNHKGCPYDGFAGGYFHSNDDYLYTGNTREAIPVCLI